METILFQLLPLTMHDITPIFKNQSCRTYLLPVSTVNGALFLRNSAPNQAVTVNARFCLVLQTEAKRYIDVHGKCDEVV